MSEVADYIFEKYHITLKTWACEKCGEYLTEIDGERVIDCRCEKDKEKPVNIEENAR